MRNLLWAAALVGWAAVTAADDGLRSPMELVAAARQEIQEISPATLAQRGSGKVLIDVREPDEFAAGHIEGAVNHPRGTLEFTVKRHPVLAALAESTPAQLADTEIVLYCRSGARSALAAQSLQSLGFRRVYSLAGGYEAWQAWQATAAK